MRQLPGLILAGLILGGQASAQAPYPAHPVTIVVPFSPGGGTDTGARVLANQLTRKWGVTAVIENRAGAAGIVGADYVAKSQPDGYTLLMGNIGTQAINPSLYKKLLYNADTAFAPLSMVADLPLILLVNPASPVNSVKDLIAAARADPGKLTYSSSGSGGAPHLAGALFEKMAGVKMLHVPYKGGGPAVADVMAGHIDLTFATILESSGQVKGGKLKAIAVSGSQRSPALPEVGTIADNGLPGYDSASWIGMLAPAGTPRPVIEKLAHDIREAVNDPQVRAQLIGQGATPNAATSDEFAATIKRDAEKYARIIREQKLTVE